MYNTIIVPTDFSDEESTIKSIKQARSLCYDGRVILFHALEEIPSYALVNVSPEILKDLVPKTTEKLNQLISRSGAEAEVEIRTGSPHRQIISLVKETDADLIMINSHRPGLKDYLLGSTAAKVVRHAPCSVLVIR